MKRLLVACALVAMLSNPSAAYVTHIPSAASNYGISLAQIAQSFSVMPHTADISVETYIGTTAIDSFLVKAGSGPSVYSPCDSIYIIRPTATAVTVNASYSYYITPMLYGAGLVDSLVELATAPTPVSVSEHTLFSGINMYSGVQGSSTNLKSGHMTFPATAGPNVDGAKALELVLDWANFEHGGFRVEHVFASSSTDTAAYYYSGTGWTAISDTVAVSDTTGYLSITADVAGSVVIRIPSVPGAGYYFCRIYPWGTAHAIWINGLNGTLREVQ